MHFLKLFCTNAKKLGLDLSLLWQVGDTNHDGALDSTEIKHLTDMLELPLSTEDITAALKALFEDNHPNNNDMSMQQFSSYLEKCDPDLCNCSSPVTRREHKRRLKPMYSSPSAQVSPAKGKKRHKGDRSDNKNNSHLRRMALPMNRRRRRTVQAAFERVVVSSRNIERCSKETLMPTPSLSATLSLSELQSFVASAPAVTNAPLVVSGVWTVEEAATHFANQFEVVQKQAEIEAGADADKAAGAGANVDVNADADADVATNGDCSGARDRHRKQRGRSGSKFLQRLPHLPARHYERVCEGVYLKPKDWS
jgi:hypothetical protein